MIFTMRQDVIFYAYMYGMYHYHLELCCCRYPYYSYLCDYAFYMFRNHIFIQRLEIGVGPRQRAHFHEEAEHQDCRYRECDGRNRHARH